MTLLDSQQQALIKLKKYKVGALFMKPGSGKTRVACELINDAKPDYVLWITPFQTKANLEAEINKWGYKFPQEIIGIESFPTQIVYTSTVVTNLKTQTIATLLWMKA